MAFTLDNISVDGKIVVIVKQDTALDVTDAEYDEYLKSGLDEGKLKFKPGISPTRWVMNKSIKYRQQQQIDNQKIKFAGGEAQIQMGYTAEEVRACLCEIKYEDDVPVEKRLVLKRDGDGMVQEDFMVMIGQAGVTLNLFQARQAYLDFIKGGGTQVKKD